MLFVIFSFVFLSCLQVYDLLLYKIARALVLSVDNITRRFQTR